MPASAAELQDLIPGFEPETPLEAALVADRNLREGLAWGVPRWGHPEGSVGLHVSAILAEIPLEDPRRAELRLIALLHDSQKVRVRPDIGWTPQNDHAVMARRLAEHHLDDEAILSVIECHDEPFWIWSNGGGQDGALAPVLSRVPDGELFVRFVELDAATEGKDVSFLWWFHREVAAQGIVVRRPQGSEARADRDGETLYVKTFAVEPRSQATVVEAAQDVIVAGARELDAQGDVLASEDGLRVLLVWRWRGTAAHRLMMDGSVVAEALTRHPVLRRARAVDARLYRVSGFPEGAVAGNAGAASSGSTASSRVP